MTLKETRYQQVITIMGINTSNILVSDFIKESLPELKPCIHYSIVTMVDINTWLLPMHRSSRNKLNRDKLEVNYIKNKNKKNPNGSDRNPQNIPLRHQRISVLLSSLWNFFHNRRHTRTQSKTQQILENWNHILHFT